MINEPSGRMIILSGPSCVGKSPLDKALKKFYPELRDALQLVVLYNDREIRPGERDGIDYYFRSRSFIESFKSDERYVVIDVRGDLQALDLEELNGNLQKGDVFFEGNPFIGITLLTHPTLQHVKKLSVFMSPLSRDEILFLRSSGKNISLPDLLTDIMQRKLLRRTRKQKRDISLKDLENIERRASSTYRELKEAHHFQYVIPNHDGEDSENWDAFYYPLGDAKKALDTFVSLLKGEPASRVESWDKDLLP
jgi:guanylate kinase